MAVRSHTSSNPDPRLGIALGRRFSGLIKISPILEPAHLSWAQSSHAVYQVCDRAQLPCASQERLSEERVPGKVSRELRPRKLSDGQHGLPGNTHCGGLHRYRPSG